MTAEPQNIAPADLVSIQVPKITTTGDQAGERIPFQLDPCCAEGTTCTHPGCECEDPTTCEHPWGAETRNAVMWATRPKNMLLMVLGAAVSAAEGDPEQKLPLYRQFLRVAVEDSDLIWDRLGDPTDDLDEPHMDALIRTFMSRWMPGRPTGPLSGPPSLQRGTGRPSTERSRSTARTRNT